MDYFDRIDTIKKEIIKEICSLIEGKGLFYFDCPFVVYHQYDFQDMSKQTCYSVRNNYGTLSILVREEDSLDKELISGEDVFGYTSESLVKILCFVKSTLQEKVLRQIKDLVSANGNSVNVDGKIQLECGLYLHNVVLTANDEVQIKLNATTDFVDTAILTLNDLKKMLEYMRDIKTHKFRVKITASRVLSVTAKSYEEASQIARENLKKHPFDEGDIDCTEVEIDV